MSFAYLSILIALALIFVPRFVVVAALMRDGGLDNRHPRAQQQKLTGWGARAQAAHQNSFEAFAPFAAAVLVAETGGGDPERIALLCGVFLVARVVYIGLYIANLATLRSLVWSAGLVATVLLFVQGL